MAKKTIKFRLFTWFEEVDSPVQPGTKVLAERIAHFGETVDITNPAYVKRGEELGAFYTDEEAKSIEEGTYSGSDAALLNAARTGQHAPPATVAPADGEHGDISQMDAAALAEYILEHNLNVDKTVALAGDDEESITKVLDAENMGVYDSRKGVTDRLEAKLAAATQK